MAPKLISKTKAKDVLTTMYWIIIKLTNYWMIKMKGKSNSVHETSATTTYTCLTY